MTQPIDPPAEHCYRKKPIVIQAFQITQERRLDNRDWPEWLNYAWNFDRSHVGAVSPYKFGDGDGPLGVMTLEGFMKCDIGDWIVRGVKGEIYPCKPDIFEATYERAPQTAAPTSHPLVTTTTAAAAQESETLREKNRSLEAGDIFIADLAFQIDRVEEHLEGGRLKGDGKWRIDEIVNCMVRMCEINDERRKATSGAASTPPQEPTP